LKELEIKKDPAFWLAMSETVREKCIKLGPAYFKIKTTGFQLLYEIIKTKKVIFLVIFLYKL